jgi:hypothetical protein
MKRKLISETKRWQWLITWDNAFPKDSSSMHAALNKLGKVVRVQTKTTVLFAPYASSHYTIVRTAIENNLHGLKGNCVYLNLKTSKAFQFDHRTNPHWKRVK